MKPEQITVPDEVVEALCVERYAEFHWDRCSDEFKRLKRKEARAEIAVGLAAWPGAAHHIEGEPGRENEEIILPLKKEGV